MTPVRVAARVAVVGGGFSGAMFAVHLLRAARRPFEIVVVEPRARLGAGLAYGSAAPEHRINVPSDKMVVFREDPLHLTRWVRAQGLFESDPAAVTVQGHHYMRRDDFGRYVAGLVDAALHDAPRGSTLRHLRTRATGLERQGAGYRVSLAEGEALAADAVVLTASHEAPAFPWPVTGDPPRLVRDPWTQLAALDVASWGPSATVAIAGTGLTMCDVLVSLRERGFAGRVVAVSRRALLPHVQGVFSDAFDLLQGEAPPASARALLRCVRRAVQRADDWREPLDAVRFMLPRLWHALPAPERRRALERLRAFWDVHRFRMAPQVHALVQRELAQGSLVLMRGRIRSIDGTGGNPLRVHWQRPGGPPEALDCDAFVNCTGPAADVRSLDNPLVQAVLASGLAVPDPVGIGFDGDADGRLRDREGGLADHLCVAGPLARAAMAEVTGVPEASAHTRRVAERWAADPSLGTAKDPLP